MKILSWNVNGYRAVLKKDYRHWLHSSGADVICLQETKAWAEQLKGEEVNPDGYVGIFSRPERKGYSGVATFIKPPAAPAVFGYGLPKFDREGRVIITDHRDFLLANIYFPNGKQNSDRLQFKMDFYEATLDLFSRLRSEGRQVVVVGDYNTAHQPIDLARPKENETISGFLPEEREWIDRWIEAGFVDIFRRLDPRPENYTWWDMRTFARDRNIGWRIDYFFITEGLLPKVKRAWIEPGVMGSDHCPIGLELNL